MALPIPHRVLLAGLDAPTASAVQAALRPRGAQPITHPTPEAALADALARAGEMHLLIAPAGSVAMLSEALPGQPILAVLPPGAGVQAVLAAQRAGAAQVAGSPLVPDDFLAAADGIVRQYPAPGRRGRLIAVVGVTGGCGATTLALTLAQEIGARAPAGRPGCVLIEVPRQMGALATYLGLEPRVTTRELLADGARLTPQGLRAALTTTSAGLEVLAGPYQGLAPGVAPARAAARLAEAARVVASTAVIDVPCTLDDALFETLAAADLVLLVGVQSVASVRALRTVRDLLVREEGLQAIEVVVNRHDASLPGFEAGRLAELLGVPAVWTVADDDAALTAAANHGRPLREAAPHSPAAADVRRLATAALGTQAPPTPARPPMQAARRVRVLHIEDDPVLREIVAIHLRRMKALECTTVAAESEEAGVERFIAEKPDLVLLDYHLEQGDGMGCLRKLRALDPLVPILVVSGLNEPGLAARLLGAGADDFLSKDNLAGERLLEAVLAALDRAGAVRARRRSQPDSLLTLAADLQVAATPGRFSVGTIQRLSDQLCAELERAAPGAPLPRRAVLSLLLRLFGSVG